jgi:hypothetical protein
VSKLWKVLDRLNVMSFKSLVRAAHSASVAALLSDFGLPSQVFRASTAVVLSLMLPHGHSHASGGAEESSVDHGSGLAGGLPAIVTGAFDPVVFLATGFGAERPDSPLMGGGTTEHNSAMIALDVGFSSAADSETRPGTVPFLGVLIPVSIRLFANDIPADFARLEYSFHESIITDTSTVSMAFKTFSQPFLSCESKRADMF